MQTDEDDYRQRAAEKTPNMDPEERRVVVEFSLAALAAARQSEPLADDSMLAAQIGTTPERVSEIRAALQSRAADA